MLFQSDEYDAGKLDQLINQKLFAFTLWLQGDGEAPEEVVKRAEALEFTLSEYRDYYNNSDYMLRMNENVALFFKSIREEFNKGDDDLSQIK